MKIANLFEGALASAAAAAIIACAAASPADAAVYTVYVWTGAPDGVHSSTVADAADQPSGGYSAAFQYSGPINWVNNQPQNHDSSGNLAKDFLDIAAISSFSSPVYADAAAFGNSSLSIAGDAYATYFEIFGFNAAPTIASITHDDGASVYALSPYVALYSSPTETSAVTGNFLLPTGFFAITYVEGNGAPSDLIFTTTAVPELSSWAMMIIGFGGVALQMRRRERAIGATA